MFLLLGRLRGKINKSTAHAMWACYLCSLISSLPLSAMREHHASCVKFTHPGRLRNEESGHFGGRPSRSSRPELRVASRLGLTEPEVLRCLSCSTSGRGRGC